MIRDILAYKGAHPFDSAMRSLLIGIYELDIEEIFVIGHTDCGARITGQNRWTI